MNARGQRVATRGERKGDACKWRKMRKEGEECRRMPVEWWTFFSLAPSFTEENPAARLKRQTRGADEGANASNVQSGEEIGGREERRRAGGGSKRRL